MESSDENGLDESPNTEVERPIDQTLITPLSEGVTVLYEISSTVPGQYTVTQPLSNLLVEDVGFDPGFEPDTWESTNDGIEFGLDMGYDVEKTVILGLSTNEPIAERNPPEPKVAVDPETVDRMCVTPNADGFTVEYGLDTGRTGHYYLLQQLPESVRDINFDQDHAPVDWTREDRSLVMEVFGKQNDQSTVIMTVTANSGVESLPPPPRVDVDEIVKLNKLIEFITNDLYRSTWLGHVRRRLIPGP